MQLYDRVLGQYDRGGGLDCGLGSASASLEAYIRVADSTPESAIQTQTHITIGVLGRSVPKYTLR